MSHPTRDDLLTMAFVDDQLDQESRAAFQERLATEPSLASEVAALQRLDVFARSAKPSEPIDFVWKAIDEAPLQQAALGLGWLLACAGALGVFAMVLFGLIDSGLPLWQKASILAVISGFTLIFLAVLKRRIQSKPFDPYTAVKR